MTNGNDSAFSKPAFVSQQGVVDPPQEGLTKREYFAGLAMQGLLRNHLMIDTMNEYSKDWISKHSILIADELLKQLETK